MNFYFDRDNLVSFIKSAKSDNYADCLRFIKNQRCFLHINCSKEEVYSSPEISDWIKMMTDGFNGVLKFNNNIFPPRPIKSNAYVNFNSKDLFSSVFLINDIDAGKLSKKGCFLFADVGCELAILSKLYFDDYQFSKNISLKKIADWSFVSEYAMPLTDVIIADCYCFSKPKLINYNIISFLKELTSKAKENSINIVIYTLNEDLPKRDELMSMIGRIQNVLKRGIGSHYPPNITIVVLGSKIDFGEHDRTIFTNYQFMDSGPSIGDFFDSNKRKISRGRHFHIHSIVSYDNNENANAFIDDMQSLIARATYIIGDKKSNYLSFR